MYLNSKGSILVTTLIIFSIIITISMMCIGLHYSNSNIFNLEYKEADIKEKGYGSIDIVHSNIIKEVNLAMQNTSNEDEFNNYFLGNNFFNNIKDISKSDIDKTSINIPTKINIDNTNDFVKFKIVSTVRDDIYVKKFQASVKIKNPFSHNIINKEEQILEENLGDELKIQSHELDKFEVNNGKMNALDDREFKNEEKVNINELVEVFDYKEI